MENYYTAEKNIQILISLLKAHKIKKIVASPGATNASFVYSVQFDGEFELYSAPDERSAAYIACGLAAESGEAVAISCTGATSSRNYMPGLTEAFYRKLPILAITSTLPECNVGHHKPQVIDRSVLPNDIAKISVTLPAVYKSQDEWICEINTNKALLELKRHGGGPVHINLVTTYSKDFSVKRLPEVNVIDRITVQDQIPMISGNKIAVFVGAHRKWTRGLTIAVDNFCEKYNAVVLCDHTSNYRGKYRVLCPLVTNINYCGENTFLNFDIVIHIGEISGAYIPLNSCNTGQVWRVSADGEICDTFKSLRYVFEMEEINFFEKYTDSYALDENTQNLIIKWKEEYSKNLTKIPTLPFSNAWIAQNTSMRLPENSVLHLGILNSLRSWNFFETPDSILEYCNVGGFGIDGCLSTLIGSSLSDTNKLHFCVLGDLAFFYDMNSIANCNVGTNIRILLINNGCGGEFKLYNHLAARFNDNTDKYIAAAGHYGNKSKQLVKNYAENLGFEYFSVFSKEEYLDVLPRFVQQEHTGKPILIEAFINPEDDSNALKLINNINMLKENPDNNGSISHILSSPIRIINGQKKMQVIPWGAGESFLRNVSAMENYCEIKYVCDINSEKWGKEIVKGVKCISPVQLKEVENAFVVIMVENIDIAFQIVNQLLDMQITSFDYFHNWKKYADEEFFHR